MDPSEVKWEEFNKLQCPPQLLKSPSQNPMWPNPQRTPLLLWREQKKPLQPTNSAERVFCVLSALSREDWLVHPSWPSLHSKESAICRFIDFCTPPSPPPTPKRGLKIEALLSYKGRGSNYFNSWHQKKIVVLQTWKIVIQWILPSKFK
jgi:hypothetical protein